MARAAKPAPARRKKIRVYRQDQGGDIQFSKGVAKIRLTPKVVLLFILLAGAAVGVVILAARQGGKQVLPGAPISRVRDSATAPVPPVTQDAEAGGPVIESVELVPSVATAGNPLELKFIMGSKGEGETSFIIRWYVNDRPVQEGPSSTLQPGMFGKGSVVYADLTATDSNGKSAMISSTPVSVGNSPPQLTGVTLEPKRPARGGELTATAAASDTDGDPLTCRYEWLVNGVPAAAAGTGNTFSTAAMTKQDAVSVSAVCTDGVESTLPAVSNIVFFENGDPRITSSAPDSVQNGLYTYQVSASDPDGDNLQYRLDHGPAGIAIDAASGLLQWTVPKGVMYTGRNEVPVKVTVDDGNGGTASQEFVIVLIDYVNY